VNIKQHLTIEHLFDLAIQLELWPDDPEMHPDGQNLMALRFYATDGSFNVTPESVRDILTSEPRLRSRGKGAGGIVFMPCYRGSPIHGVRITSDQPEPGMNAFTWELVSQLIALHMVQYQPPCVTGFTDCTSAMARTKVALRSHNDRLAHTAGGLWASGVHMFADQHNPRQFKHIKAHPENYPERAKNPTEQDKAIFMADALAGNTFKKLGGKVMPMTRHHLKLEHLLNEIIPLRQWHFRTATLHATPVLNNIIEYQHQAQLDLMMATRDRSNDEDRWASTSLAFANEVHPPSNTSFWAAGRRSLIILDWLGHGRNRAKMKPQNTPEWIEAGRCVHCRLPDSQEHCMLQCNHAAFTPIRRTARVEQSQIAAELIRDSRDEQLTHFIQMLFHASWLDTPQTKRLWLGTWQLHTLQSLIGQALDDPLTLKQRYNYIGAAKKLAAPLLKAYHLMIDINIKTPTTPLLAALPLHDHVIHDINTLPLHHAATHLPNAPCLPLQRQRELENTFIQDHNPQAGPGTHNAQALNNLPYTLSDSAFSEQEAADRMF